MKRCIAMLLTLLLLTGSSCAMGEANDSAVLRVVEAWWGTEDYQKQYPERKLEITSIEYDENKSRQVQNYLLEHPNEWDIAMIWTNECDLSLLCEAGLLMELSGEDRLSSYYQSLYPKVREVIARDDGIYAIPTMLFDDSTQAIAMTNEERLNPLGLSWNDAPQTYAELRKLAEQYMAMPKAQRKGTAFHVDGNQGSYQDYFLYCFIKQYTAEFCDTKGVINYDTDAFRQGLEDIQAMGKVLGKDKKVQFTQGASIYGITADGGGLVEFGEWASLRLRIGDQLVVPVRMGMLVINNNTKHLQEALEFADITRKQCEVQFSMVLAEVDYDALYNLYYDETIAGQKEQGEQQQYITALEEERASGSTRGFYTKEAIAEYAQNLAPLLTFPLMPRMDIYAIGKQFSRGTLDADGLIKKLQSIADEQLLRKGPLE